MHSLDPEDGVAEREYTIEEGSMSSFSDAMNESREQSKALLGGDDASVGDAEKLYSQPDASRRTPYYTLRAIALCLVAALLGLLVVSQLFTGASLSPSTHVAGRNGTDQEYVLSQKWDFDAPSVQRVYNWVITDKELNPDGVYRPMIVINGQFPGPLVEVNEGDTIVVNIDNQAANATSIHWHGLFQNGTNWMDGTVGVTQCPIAPGSHFTYKFNVGQQYGTYWYHAHQGIQASDGLMGPLIIHSKKELELQGLQYSTDRVVMVSDHYHDLSSALLMKYLKSDAENAEPVPDGALINGRGVRDCSIFGHRRCDNSSVSLPRFDLEENKNHRLRLINTGAFAEFQVSIDEHEFAVTEVDGTTVLPSYYDRINVNPAQRYSIIVSSNATAKSSFWFRAKMLTTCFTDPPSYLDSEVKAIVTSDLSSSEDKTPSSKDWSDGGPNLECRDMNTTDLISTPAIAAPATADATFYLRSNFEIGGWRLSRGFFNKTSWKADVQKPMLHRAIDGLSSSNASWDVSSSSSSTSDVNPLAFVNTAAFDTKRELVIETTGIQTIDLIISNFDDGNHPLHLHGYKFFVLAQGHGYPPADLASTVDVSNPLRRDTASVEAFGWVMLRIVADNPGAWAFHCHVSWHAEAGLLMQFLTRSDEVGGMRVPEENAALCRKPVGELRKGTGPEDEVFMKHDDD